MYDVSTYCLIRLEIENARLEAAAKQQSNKIDALQKGAQEAAMVRPQCRNRRRTPLEFVVLSHLSTLVLRKAVSPYSVREMIALTL